MFSRICSTSAVKTAGRFMTQPRNVVMTRSRLTMSTVADCATANDALKYSGYSEIDFTIKEDATVYDAVQKFAAFNIGCLVTTDAAGTYLSRWILYNKHPTFLSMLDWLWWGI